MPTFSFSSSMPLDSTLQLEDGNRPLRIETDHTRPGRRERTNLVAAEKPVASVHWWKAFEVQGQSVRVKKAKVSTSFWEALVWKPGYTAYTIRSPFQTSLDILRHTEMRGKGKNESL